MTPYRLVYQIELTFMPSVSVREACGSALDVVNDQPHIIVKFSFNKTIVFASLGSLGPRFTDPDEMATVVLPMAKKDVIYTIWPPNTSEAVKRLFLDESRNMGR